MSFFVKYVTKNFVLVYNIFKTIVSRDLWWEEHFQEINVSSRTCSF